MRKTYVEIENLPRMGGKDVVTIDKITINKDDLSILEDVFKEMFTFAGTKAYWRYNKLGDLSGIPVYEGRNSKHKATVYWK